MPDPAQEPSEPEPEVGREPPQSESAEESPESAEESPEAGVEPSGPEVGPEPGPGPERGSEVERAQPQEASLEDLVAALGRPRNRSEEEEEEEEDEEAADAEPDPFAEYSNLDLATSLPIDPDDDLSKVEGEASPRLMSIIESLLFAADKPMTVKLIRRLLKEPTKRQIQLSLKQLIFDTQHRGVVLGQVAGGFRLRTHPDNAPFVQKMMAGKPARLSRSQLESLAVVAYRQPVTKAELDHIRGVDCGAVLRVLLERDLAKIVGRKEEAGRPHLYGTTVAFLEFFNLKGLRDLPDLHEFKELSEESEATLRHTVQSGSLSDEQEAMGQSRIEFPDAEGGATGQAPREAGQAAPEAGGSSDTAAPVPVPERGVQGGGDTTSHDTGTPDAAPDAESHASATPAIDETVDGGVDGADEAVRTTDQTGEATEPDLAPEAGAGAEAEAAARAEAELEAEPEADAGAEPEAALEAEVEPDDLTTDDGPVLDPPPSADRADADSNATTTEAEDSGSEPPDIDSRPSSESESSVEQPSDPTASEPDATDVAAADDLPKDEP